MIEARNTMTMTADELKICEWVGKKRYQHAVDYKRNPGNGPSSRDPSPANHIRGAECEFAGSVILNLWWRPTIGQIDQRDIGGLVDARSTVLGEGRLVIRETDPDDVPFILILKRTPLYFALGWMFAGVAKRWPLLTAFGDPAHFIPQSELWEVDRLREWTSEHGRCAA